MFGDRPERLRLAGGEGEARVVAVARDHGAADQLGEPERRLGPVERVAVVEEGDGAAFDQVAGEDHVRVRHRDDDVVVGVPSPEVAQLQQASADLDHRIDRAKGLRDGGQSTCPQIVAGRKTRLPKA